MCSHTFSPNTPKKVGFIINPIAGMGGRVGLKGTDNVLDKAIELGAKPVSPDRAREFLNTLRSLITTEEVNLEIITCRDPMGEREVKEANLAVEVIDIPKSKKTTAQDTKDAVKVMVDMGIDILVFVGGDGTARDIYDALKEKKKEDFIVLGVPAGVKMYSGVFAINPREAAYILIDYFKGSANVTELELMDIDEEAFRKDQLVIKLYGYMRCPYIPFRMQHSKQVSPDSTDERDNQEAIAQYIIENMDKNSTYILGPGTTVKCIADLLGIRKTLLGVDIYYAGRVINDVNECQLLDFIKRFKGKNIWIIVSPIGRQGMIFGRGNQQISPKVIKAVGRDRIIVIATRRKLRDIEGEVLRVDTGDPEVDEYLRGYIKVFIDYATWRVVKVK